MSPPRPPVAGPVLGRREAHSSSSSSSPPVHAAHSTAQGGMSSAWGPRSSSPRPRDTSWFRRCARSPTCWEAASCHRSIVHPCTNKPPPPPRISQASSCRTNPSIRTRLEITGRLRHVARTITTPPPPSFGQLFCLYLPTPGSIKTLYLCTGGGGVGGNNAQASAKAPQCDRQQDRFTS